MDRVGFMAADAVIKIESQEQLSEVCDEDAVGAISAPLSHHEAAHFDSGAASKHAPQATDGGRRRRRRFKMPRSARLKGNGEEEEIIVGVESSEPVPAEHIKVEVEVDEKSESESYFYIKKKRDRRFSRVFDSMFEVEDAKRAKGEEEDEDKIEEEEEEQSEIEISVSEDAAAPEADPSVRIRSDDDADAVPFNWFLTKTMFKRVGRPCDALIECKICFKQMKDTSMKQHFKTHSGVKPYHCSCCGARFTRRWDVYRHRRAVHRCDKPFECSVCQKRFVKRRGLIMHLRNHDRVLYYPCATCGFKFGKKEYFENHLKYIHPQPEGQKMARLADVKDIGDRGESQLQQLLAEEAEEMKRLKNMVQRERESMAHKRGGLSVAREVNSGKARVDVKEECKMSCIEEEAEEMILSLPEDDEIDSKLKNELELFEEEDLKDTTDKKATLNYTHEVSAHSVECKEEEDLVNRAIEVAISQAEKVLEGLQSSLGANLRSKCSDRRANKERVVRASAAKVNAPKSVKPKSSEIHINATVGGSARKFVIQVPSGTDIDATTQEGMDALVNIVNYLCSGKGELSGPVEVVMHHSV